MLPKLWGVELGQHYGNGVILLGNIILLSISDLSPNPSSIWGWVQHMLAERTWHMLAYVSSRSLVLKLWGVWWIQRYIEACAQRSRLLWICGWLNPCSPTFFWLFFFFSPAIPVAAQKERKKESKFSHIVYRLSWNFTPTKIYVFCHRLLMVLNTITNVGWV